MKGLPPDEKPILLVRIYILCKQKYHYNNWKLKFSIRYPDPNYNNRLNYYSTTTVKFNNIPTGDVNNNNALLLTQRRFLMQAVGNEGTSCGGPVGKIMLVKLKLIVN